MTEHALNVEHSRSVVVKFFIIIANLLQKYKGGYSKGITVKNKGTMFYILFCRNEVLFITLIFIRFLIFTGRGKCYCSINEIKPLHFFGESKGLLLFRYIVKRR
ncbi:hypothetical protein BTO08_15555 [Photobacterium angustum]|uniref:Uncharacterized protein n=1 Tax=Photobacterium angustum TaxID=661 RepID=A0A2S7VIC5_PHOAN|nr:hypothetical protein BTO08_15555 [Photobacterium angustum]